MKNTHKNILSVLYSLAGTDQVFVYATLLNPKLRQKLLKRDPDTYIDKLAGFREISVDSIEGENYHTLIPDENIVLGRRFFVTPKELHILDRYEEQYIRKKVRLKSGNFAWVYFLKIASMKNEGRDLKP